MKIVVFDTETTSLEKPFVYNIGYIIADTDTQRTLVSRDYVVEQIWHNEPLFCSAYYANKRPIYVKAMRSRRTLLEKFGYICQQMIRDFRQYGVERAFAFNSDFDERVFEFNCDWFKCANPFDTVPIADIRGFAHHFLIDYDYKEFCDTHELYTDAGNYSTTAEDVYRYLTGDTDFSEEHTALADSEIEMEVLFACLNRGAYIVEEYKAFRSIPRNTEKDFAVIDAETGEVLFDRKCKKIKINKTRTTVEITSLR